MTPGGTGPTAWTRLHSRSSDRVAGGWNGLAPGTTHDTKRSADARARLLALAEVAPEFEAGLVRFGALIAVQKTGSGNLVPSALELRLVAATLLAVAPAGAGEAEWGALADRVGEALRKAAREAKVHTSWTEPDAEYEEALIAVARQGMSAGGAVLQEAFGDLVEEVASLGATLSLGQVVLRSLLPGVPDCYQGDESWNFSLVDPDNRRPVDFAGLAGDLALLVDPPSPEGAAALGADWRNGLVKLHVTRQCLRARALAPEAFAPGAGYLPLRAAGTHADNVVSFARTGSGGDGGSQAITVASRMPRQLMAPRGQLPVGRRAWGDTVLELPSALRGTLGQPAGPPDEDGNAPADSWYDVLSGRRLVPEAGSLDLGTILADLPVAVLVRGRGVPSAAPPPSEPPR